jgi:hypothetical protein
VTNDDLFDRFLDNLELYTDLRTEYKQFAKAYYATYTEDNFDSPEGIAALNNLNDREEIIFQQKINMQKILEEIISNGNQPR